MLIKRHQLSKGMSLIELLIGLALSLILFTALIVIFSTNVTNSAQSLKIAKLNAQLQGALDLMSNEIRRAGYWGTASTAIGASTNTNPFMSASNGTDINVQGGSCILFTYDHSGNGVLGAITSSSDDERYGFRLSGQTLQLRPYGASFSCSAAASAWENVTDSNVVLITNLAFTYTSNTVVSSGATSAMVRYIGISITGQLANNSAITKTLTTNVRVRNDRFTPP